MSVFADDIASIGGDDIVQPEWGSVPPDEYAVAQARVMLAREQARAARSEVGLTTSSSREETLAVLGLTEAEVAWMPEATLETVEAALDVQRDNEDVPPPTFVGVRSIRPSLDAEQAWLIENTIGANGLTIVTGHPKSGKTLAVLQMGASWVSGETFLSLVPDVGSSARRVFMYATEEGSRALMAERIDTLVSNFPALDDDNFLVSYLSELSFDSESRARVEAVLSALEPGTQAWLVLDPLRDFFPADPKWDENSAQTMGWVKHWCRALLARYPLLTLTLIHHDRKSSEGTSGLEMSGSGALYGAVDGTINWVRKNAPETASLASDEEEPVGGALVSLTPFYGRMRVETRGAEGFGCDWHFDRDSGMFRRGGKSSVVIGGTAAVREQLLAALGSVGRSGATVSDLATVIGKAPNVVRARLATMLSEGAVFRSSDIGLGRGHSALWYASEYRPGTEDDGFFEPVEDSD